MSIEVLSGAFPAPAKSEARDGAFRTHASGLIVPAEMSREREVWTWAEWRALEKATALLQGRGLQIFLRCGETAECSARPLERVRHKDGSILLRCAHKDRIFRRDL